MYILYRNGFNHAEWNAISASSDMVLLQNKADALNLEEYSREYSEWLERGRTWLPPFPLDDPRRNGYQTFFVKEVPDWPAIELG